MPPRSVPITQEFLKVELDKVTAKVDGVALAAANAAVEKIMPALNELLAMKPAMEAAVRDMPALQQRQVDLQNEVATLQSEVQRIKQGSIFHSHECPTRQL